MRDSLTSVGDYVLTCRWDNEVLHFKISKVLVKSNETKVRIKTLTCFFLLFFQLSSLVIRLYAMPFTLMLNLRSYVFIQ